MKPRDTDIGFEILHEDDCCLVVIKPGGVLTQAPPGIDSLELRVKRYLKDRHGREGKIYLGVPHRLDRPVSGVMVLGKSRKAARRLSEQFAGRLVKKTYWAVVSGAIDEPQGTWTDYVRKVPNEARAEVTGQQARDGRLAILHFHKLADLPKGTALEIELETGRTHQIRVQTGSRGHAVLGDGLYGSPQAFGPQTEDLRERRIALFARRLEFRHPNSREPMGFESPLPADWQDFGLT